jgi:calcineurin-like phosphoesterase family protein
MSLWFTSDLHLGHTLVAEQRGFPTVREHDDAVLDALRAVPSADELWVLGDLTRGGGVAERAALGRLRVLKKHNMHLVAGNHDSCSPLHHGAWERLPMFQAVFRSVQAYAKVTIAGQGVLLSHFPYADYPYDHVRTDKPVKHLQYHLPNLGAWLLHGHTHSGIRSLGNSVHVGLDAWGMRTVHVDEVAALMTPPTIHRRGPRR